MITFNRSDWRRQLGMPLLIIFIPVLVSLIIQGELMLLLIPVSLAIGWVLRPGQIWPIWLGSVAVMWVVYGLNELFNLFPDEPNAGEETIWSFAIESFIFMAVLVLLPLWIGRILVQISSRWHLGART